MMPDCLFPCEQLQRSSHFPLYRWRSYLLCDLVFVSTKYQKSGSDYMGVLPSEPSWCRQCSLLSVGLAECLATGILVYAIACTLVWAPADLAVPIGIGGTVIALCSVFGDLSGAHFNPAITVSYYLTEARFGFWRLTVYLLSQIIGAIIGTSLAIYNSNGFRNPYSVQALKERDFVVLQIGVSEIIWTCLLCMCALRAGFLARQPSPLTPIWVAGVIVAGSYGGGAISGNCMNPALAIAFVIQGGTWVDLIVYSIAPTAGAVLAAVLVMTMDPDVWARRVGVNNSSAANFAAAGGHTRNTENNQILTPTVESQSLVAPAHSGTTRTKIFVHDLEDSMEAQKH